MRQLSIAFTILLLAAVPVCSEIYTYTDASGNVAYVEDLGKVPAKYRDRAKLLEEIEPISVMDSTDSAARKGVPEKRNQAKGGAAEKKRFSGTIELYVTSWCPVCRDAETYIKKMGYPYVKYDIEKDSAAKSRNGAYPGRGVPLVLVGDKNFRGFSGDTLEYYMSQ